MPMWSFLKNLHKKLPGVGRVPTLEQWLYSIFGEEKAVYEVFDAWALGGRDAHMESGHGPVARRLFERLHLASDAHYLDIGCGNGYTVRWAAARAHHGRAVGIDISPQMVSRALELSVAYPHAEFYEADFPHHQLSHGSFDAILSIEAIYYFSNLPSALVEIRKLLKPGGTFVSAVDYYLENKESHRWPVREEVHMNLLSARSWHQAFEAAGFTSVEQERLVIPKGEAVERWHMTAGSLVTSGRRAVDPN